MIIVKIVGGLGNQLFQYATGRAIAHRNKVKLKLDTLWFNHQRLRTYKLENFNIAASIASPTEIAHMKGTYRRGIKGKLFARFQRSLPYYKRSVFIERQRDRFDENIFKVKKNVCLAGYWQNEKYFKDIIAILSKELSLKEPLSHDSQLTAEKIQNTNSVSLHVRRGDYVGHQTHSTCSPGYYQTANNLINNNFNHPHFFVFSDDFDWVKKYISTDHSFTYVTYNGQKNDYQDLILMSLCEHHIIANSSFSWWGAWLNQKPNNIVIAPKKWFNNPERYTRDLIPKNWIQI